MSYAAKSATEFQSTLPLWGATHGLTVYTGSLFISIHAPLVGSDAGHGGLPLPGAISIHAPLVGSDY